MKIIKVNNYNELSKEASNIIVSDILKKPDLTIGFATGKTPLGLYRNLVNAYKNKKISFSKIKSFNLDEFYPIKKSDRGSYRHYMLKNLFEKVNIKKENINLLDGTSKNYKKECEKYEKKIKSNSIDVIILGIGDNGHVGFNEPGSLKDSKTRLVELTHRKGKALTMGISTIMKSKKIILLAFGERKAEAIYGLVKGKISKDLPASLLRNHKDFILIADKDACSLI